ncbi:MAG: hypothetical protein QXD61_11420, partial [Candidatus Caldarchaeum sp.]
SRLLERVAELVQSEDFELLTYGTPYGLVPFSLVNVFPHSQTTFPPSLMRDLERDMVGEIIHRLKQARYKKIVILDWGRDVYPGFVNGLAAALRQELEAEVVVLRRR